jgi:hypothetical protein
MAALTTNAGSSPDFDAIFAGSTALQYTESQHYDMALARAEYESYRAPMIAFD